MYWIRLLLVVLVLAAVALAAVPLLVLFDLASGGTGWGLCPGGITECRNPYTAAPELAVTLTVALFVVVGGLRLMVRLSQRMKQRAEEWQE